METIEVMAASFLAARPTEKGPRPAHGRATATTV